MSFSVKYSKSRRMIVSGLCCDCPFDHRTVTQDVYIGSGVLEGLPAMVKRRDMGKRLVLIADENTYKAAGIRVKALLENAGFAVTELVMDSRAVSDEKHVGQALLTMGLDTDFFVSVGSGCVTDITRVVASQTERPMACVATSASTTAYTSVVAKACLNGFVSTIRTTGAEVVVCDMDVIKLAPKSTVRAGFAEMMTKYFSATDWRILRLINCEKLCHTYAQALIQAADNVLDAADEIASGSESGLYTLTQSVIVSGQIIAMTGSNRCSESYEHAFADLCQTERLRAGLDAPSYSDCLSAGILNSLEMTDRLKALTNAEPDREKLRGFDLEREIRLGFGNDAEKVARLWRDTSSDFISRQLEAFAKRFPSVRNALGDIPDSERISDAMRRVGCINDATRIIQRSRAAEYAPYLTGACGLMGLGNFISGK